MLEEYAGFCDLFARAELRLKVVEKISTVASTPSINELRYAACHLRRSFLSTEPTVRNAEIASAERHCRRSIYDSCSVIVDVINCWMQEYMKGFSFVPISSVIPTHLEMQKRIKEAVRFLDDHNHDEADAVCMEIETRMKDLVDIRETYEIARDDLLRAARARNFKSWLAVAAIVIPAAIAILAVILK